MRFVEYLSVMSSGAQQGIFVMRFSIMSSQEFHWRRYQVLVGFVTKVLLWNLEMLSRVQYRRGCITEPVSGDLQMYREKLTRKDFLMWLHLMACLASFHFCHVFSNDQGIKRCNKRHILFGWRTDACIRLSGEVREDEELCLSLTRSHVSSPTFLTHRSLRKATYAFCTAVIYFTTSIFSP